MKKIQRFASLLVIVFILLSSGATSYAASCPPHPDYVLMNAYEANKGSVGSHSVNGKTCTLYEIVDVYEFECISCPHRITTSYYSHIYHSICR